MTGGTGQGHFNPRNVHGSLKAPPLHAAMRQVVRNLIDDFDGFLRGKRFLIHDRDPHYTRVLSIKSECLDRMILLGERHLRRAIASYVEHYHLERCHQGIGNRLIDGVPESASGPVARQERLGGLLSHYYREAA